MGCLTSNKSVKVLLLAVVFGNLIYAGFYIYAYRQIQIKLDKVKEHYQMESDDTTNEQNEQNTAELMEITRSVHLERRKQLMLAVLWTLSMIFCSLSGTSFECVHKLTGFLYFGLFAVSLFATSVMFSQSFSRAEKPLDAQIARFNEFV